MSEKETSYIQILKSTSIFGGVQIFSIIITIIKSKLIAILIGPTGLGIVGLLNSTLSFIGSITNFGIERSAIRNIAEANATGDSQKISKVVSVLRKIVWVTGLLGVLTIFILSPYLSKITFGNEKFTYSFIWLACTLLINQISSGQGVVLRGMRQINYMAKSSLFGALTGLIISVPIYYFWGINGVVPSIIASSVLGLIMTSYYARKVKIENVNVSTTDVIITGRNMLSLGFILSLSTIVVAGESYLIRIFIHSFGTIEDVGFYSAGFAIVNSYFGVIFTALISDYYPRLAGIAHDNEQSKVLMNQQSEITVLLIAPILVLFLLFANYIVVVLYSDKFLPIKEMLLWGSLGIYFKAASWSLGVIFISKGDVKILFWSELSATIVLLIFNVMGYYYFKLEGLGVSFLLSYMYTYFQTYIIVKIKYSYSYSNEFYKLFLIHLILGVLSFILVKSSTQDWSILLRVIVLFISIIYSYNQLNKRLSISKLLYNKLKK